MSILLLGDSNLRNCLEQFKPQLVTKIGEEVTFKMASSNETIKAHLESAQADTRIIFIMSPVNEVVKIVQKSPGKGRDETLRTVIEDLSKIVHASAKNRQRCIHVLVPPFLRKEPNWFSTRVRLGVFYVKDNIKPTSPWNIVVASPISIIDEDLNPDKIHLNDSGKQKLYEALESDIIKCKNSLEEEVHMDWASQLGDEHEPPTPSTLRKRQRQQNDQEADSDEEDGGRKKARLDSVLDKLDSLVKEIKQERGATKEEITSINVRVEENKVAVEEIKTQVTEIQANSKKNEYLTAEMRQDIDGLENENLKQVVVVRKLKADGPVPKDQKSLRAYIQGVSRGLVGKLAPEGQDWAKTVKYGAPLYSFVDPTKKDNQAGLVPPFKIGFDCKESALRFRDAALKKSKEDGSEYKKTYFSFFQTAGTRVRLMLLWSVAESIRTDTKESWINQNLPKPTLQVKEGGKIVESLCFVKTMKKYGDKIPKKTIDEATKLAKKNFSGNLKETFIVLKD